MADTTAYIFGSAEIIPTKPVIKAISVDIIVLPS
jgi:hypothetical protein